MKNLSKLIAKMRIKPKTVKNINYVSLHDMLEIKIKFAWK